MIYILVLSIILLCIVIYKELKYKNDNEKVIKYYINENLRLQNVLEETLESIKMYSQSDKNIQDGIEFYNNLKCKKYIKIGKAKVNTYSEVTQNIVIIIFEDDIVYKKNYWEDKIKVSEISDTNEYVSNLLLECRVYVDGKIIDPILLSRLYSGNKMIEIENIDLGVNVGRGIGTLIIQFLSEILPNYGVEELVASISTVDYSVKERLHNFYCMINGFNMEREVTNDKWGLAIKYLNK